MDMDRRVREHLQQEKLNNMLPLPYGIPMQVSTPIARPPDRREFIGSNNQIQSSRLIDIASKDFVLSSNGHFQGQDVVLQQVYLSLITRFNNSAQANLGNQLFNIKVITPNLINQCKSVIQLALANLINNGTISFNGVNVANNGNGQIFLQVFFTEIETQTSQTVNLPIQQGIGQ